MRHITNFPIKMRILLKFYSTHEGEYNQLQRVVKLTIPDRNDIKSLGRHSDATVSSATILDSQKDDFGGAIGR